MLVRALALVVLALLSFSLATEIDYNEAASCAAGCYWGDTSIWTGGVAPNDPANWAKINSATPIVLIINATTVSLLNITATGTVTLWVTNASLVQASVAVTTLLQVDAGSAVTSTAGPVSALNVTVLSHSAITATAIWGTNVTVDTSNLVAPQITTGTLVLSNATINSTGLAADYLNATGVTIFTAPPTVNVLGSLTGLGWFNWTTPLSLPSASRLELHGTSINVTSLYSANNATLAIWNAQAIIGTVNVTNAPSAPIELQDGAALTVTSGFISFPYVANNAGVTVPVPYIPPTEAPTPSPTPAPTPSPTPAPATTAATTDSSTSAVTSDSTSTVATTSAATTAATTASTAASTSDATASTAATTASTAATTASTATTATTGTPSTPSTLLRRAARSTPDAPTGLQILGINQVANGVVNFLIGQDVHFAFSGAVSLGSFNVLPTGRVFVDKVLTVIPKPDDSICPISGVSGTLVISGSLNCTAQLLFGTVELVSGAILTTAGVNATKLVSSGNTVINSAAAVPSNFYVQSNFYALTGGTLTVTAGSVAGVAPVINVTSSGTNSDAGFLNVNGPITFPNASIIVSEVKVSDLAASTLVIAKSIPEQVYASFAGVTDLTNIGWNVTAQVANGTISLVYGNGPSSSQSFWDQHKYAVIGVVAGVAVVIAIIVGVVVVRRRKYSQYQPV